MEFIIKTYEEYSQIEKKTNDYNIENLGISDIISESNNYLNHAIYQDILSSIKTRWVYEYEFANAHIKIYICGEHKDDFLIYYTNFVMYLFNKIKPMKRDLRLILINYEGKKQLPDVKEELTSYHVNSGVTISRDGHGEVIVYRKEEMIKVLTHELIHFCDLDEKYSDETLSASLSKKFKIICMPVNINESFVDSLACYINTIMYTVLSKPLNFKKAFKKNLMKEIRFIVDQASKVLNHVGYPNKQVCERTNVTAYYVLKALVYMDMTKYINYLSKYNYQFINQKEYLNIINYNDIEILMIKKNRSKSMRMSCLDIKNIKSF